MRAGLTLFLLLLSFAAGQTDPVDQNALIALWNGFSSKGTLSWSTAASLCGQTGVTCVSTKVTHLEISHRSIQGSISTEIGSMTGLIQLRLYGNSFSGGIPTQIGSLTSLNQLFLYNNSLSGTIPTQIALLTSLQSLSLVFNSLSGTIPTQIGLMSNLTWLFLSFNSLNGSIPTQIGALAKLMQLYLPNNFLSGSIPTQIGLLTNLRQLFLNTNRLNGTIPTQIGTLAGLTGLYLNSNDLSGTIPTEIGLLTSLGTLALPSNNLSGSIPTQIGSLTKLIQLYLGDNRLSWSIPPQIGVLAALSELHLLNNNLSGTIPTQIGLMHNLAQLWLSGNSFSGTIPTQVASLTNLTRLELQQNSFHGSIPAELESLPVWFLYLANNFFCPKANYSSWASFNDYNPSSTCLNEGTCNPSGCTCPQGFGTPYCLDFDECGQDPPPCQVWATCFNSIGSYGCTCNPGFTGDGFSCQDIDECTTGKHNCHQDATCTNTNGDFSCACNDGFAGNGTSCNVACTPKFENATSWPQTHVNTTASFPCSIPTFSVFQGSLANFTHRASRQCLPSNHSRQAVWSVEMTPCEPTCALQGCQNEGLCLSSPTFAVCICPPGYQGKFCEEGGSQRCPDIPCLHGECVNPSDINLPGYCDCTGTGFNGSLCQTDVDDCLSQPCQNGGTCFDAGPNRFLCECLVSFDGLQCQLCRNDICQNGGRCIIVKSGTLTCDCTGTGYSGTLCALPRERDCRAMGCQNGGECEWSNEGGDLKLCSCSSGYRGDFCQTQEYRSLEDENTVFFVLIPIVALFLLIVAFLSFANRKTIRSNRKAWLGLFGHVFMSCIGIFDLFTDCFFVIESYDLMVNEPTKSRFFFASLAFLVTSWLTSVVIIALVSIHWGRQVQSYTAIHPSSPAPHTRLPLGFFFAFAALSNDGIGIFHIATKYLFLEQGFQIRISSFAPYLLGFFFSKAFLEDLPQLVIQGMYQSQIGSASPVIVFSLANSALSLFFGVVLFVFSENFDGFKHWIRSRGQAKFTTLAEGKGANPIRESGLELTSAPLPSHVLQSQALVKAQEALKRGRLEEEDAKAMRDLLQLAQQQASQQARV